MARVYLETSFISACVETRDDAASQYQRSLSLQWWNERRAGYELFVSVEVQRELSDPTYPLRERALAWIDALPVLDGADNARRVVASLLAAGVFGPRQEADALHIATAATFGIDIVLTWNQRHLANPTRIRSLRQVCESLGLALPTIVTPDAMLGEPT